MLFSFDCRQDDHLRYIVTLIFVWEILGIVMISVRYRLCFESIVAINSRHRMQLIIQLLWILLPMITPIFNAIQYFYDKQTVSYNRDKNVNKHWRYNDSNVLSRLCFRIWFEFLFNMLQRTVLKLWRICLIKIKIRTEEKSQIIIRVSVITYSIRIIVRVSNLS